MLVRVVYVLVFLSIVYGGFGSTGHPACQSAECRCDSVLNVFCRCSVGSDQIIFGVDGLLLPLNMTSFTVGRCGKVIMRQDQLVKQSRLKAVDFANISVLELDRDTYNVEKVKFENIELLDSNVMENLRSAGGFDQVVFRNITAGSLTSERSGNDLIVKSLLIFDNVSISSIDSGSIDVVISLKGQALFLGSRFDRISPAGIRVSGGNIVSFSRCNFTQLDTHAIEVATETFSFLGCRTAQMDAKALVISARNVYMSQNLFSGAFAAHTLSNISMTRAYGFVGNTILQPPGVGSLLVSLEDTVTDVIIKDNLFPCTCEAKDWIRSDARLWTAGLARSSCLNVSTVPPGAHCEVRVEKFFERHPCRDQYRCPQENKSKLPDERMGRYETIEWSASLLKHS